jgi:hypothetical protein
MKVYPNLKEMFDAIRGEDGVLVPTQFEGDKTRVIRLDTLHNPDSNTQSPSSK